MAEGIAKYKGFGRCGRSGFRIDRRGSAEDLGDLMCRRKSFCEGLEGEEREMSWRSLLSGWGSSDWVRCTMVVCVHFRLNDNWKLCKDLKE